MLKPNIFKSYFRNKSNIAVTILLTIAIIFGAYVRLQNLHVLSFWWDDGATYHGTLAVLKHGYPLLQSGNISYHNILSYYFRVIPAFITGLNEVSLRLPSAIFGILMIPLVFLFTKELSNKYTGTLAAIVSSLNFWQIEFSREARYYSEFQFFYLLSVYFFYLGFFKDKNKFKIPSLILIFLTGLIQNQGFTLIFLFIPLFIYKGYKLFFKKDIVSALVITTSLIVLQLIHRILFWKVAITFFESTVESSNPVIRLLSKFIVGIRPNTFYYKIFGTMFPGMYYIFNFGIILLLLYVFIKYIRNNEEDWKNIYVKDKINLRLPFNLFLIYFIVFSNTYFLGIGAMENQQRYVFYILPFIIIGYSYVIFDIARLITIPIKKLKFKNNNIIKTKIIKNSTYLLIAIVIFLLSVNYINPIQSLKILERKNGDTVNSFFSPSATAVKHFDFKSTGNYVYVNKNPGDLVISTEFFNSYPYTKQLDHWLWSGNLREWKPYDIKDELYYDKYFGNIVIRDVYQLMDFLNENQNKNIWLITNASIDFNRHIEPKIKEFILSKENYKVYTGDDNIVKVYYFPKDETDERFFSFTSTINPADEEILLFGQNENKLLLDFTSTESSKYLNHGWSEVEPYGTWSNSKESSLFIDFNEKKDYKISMELKPLFSTDYTQVIKICFNEKLIGEEILDSPEFKILTLKIPCEYIELDTYNSFSLHFKYIKKPIDLGLGVDTRRLTVMFKYIEIKKLN